ncbi:MAG: MFS transporter [Porticoccaceae bacterium]|nr:MFS transporter [Porticoccaceae bacterium]
MAARVLLSFLTTAGLFYVNIMPALVDALVEGLGFTSRQAGLVGSSNVYGAAVGAFIIVFFVKKLVWKKVALSLLMVLISIDFLSMLISSYEVMWPLRFIHGLVGGALVGIGFSVCARTQEADRTFGMLLFVQFGLGGFGVMLIPPLVPELGVWVLFAALIIFSVITLLMLPFLNNYSLAELTAQQERDKKALGSQIQYGPLLLTLISIFLFQAANMALYAFIIGLGRSSGLSIEFISPTLGAAAWIAMAGSMLVVVLSIRFGRFLPLFLGTLLTLVGTFALHFSEVPWIFWVANVGVGITWAFVIPYLLGMSAAFDISGQMAAAGGFASKMGLASGPMVAAFLLQGENYGPMINGAVIALFLCLITAVIPAVMLDRRQAAKAVLV